MVIYLIRNTQNGMRYVGTTVRTPELRWNDHVSCAFAKALNSPLYADMRAFGKEAFELTVLEEVDDYDHMLKRERALIAELQTLMPRGYNMVKGGRGNYGWQPTPETRAAMSAGGKGRTASPETRAKMSAFHKGKIVSVETRSKMSQWQIGRKMSAAARAKMSASKKGRALTPAELAARRVPRVRSEESRALTGAKSRAWWAQLSPEERSAIAKARTQAKQA